MCVKCITPMVNIDWMCQIEVSANSKGEMSERRGCRFGFNIGRPTQGGANIVYAN